MSGFVFEDRAVAFLDILGFSAIVDNAVFDSQTFEKLKGVINLLESAVPHFDAKINDTVPRHLIPKYIYISDSIILSAPLSDGPLCQDRCRSH